LLMLRIFIISGCEPFTLRPSIISYPVPGEFERQKTNRVLPKVKPNRHIFHGGPRGRSTLLIAASSPLEAVSLSEIALGIATSVAPRTPSIPIPDTEPDPDSVKPKPGV